MRNDFAVFICTHGRPNAQYTLNKLLNSGYKGRYYLVLDDQDDSVQEYIDVYGTEHILVFDKNHYINNMDVGSRTPPYKCIVYAKNAVEDMAKDMELKAFVIADDDIMSIRYRWIDGDILRSKELYSHIDEIIDYYVDTILSTDIVASSFGGCVHYFFGIESLNNEHVQTMRIPFQFVFRNAKHDVKWISSFGEDVITAVVSNHRGELWQVLPQIELTTKSFATASGGMLDTYKTLSSFERTMYNFIYCPTGIKMLFRNGNYKASVCTNACLPKILSDKYKK